MKPVISNPLASDGHKMWEYFTQLSEQLKNPDYPFPSVETPQLSEGTLDVWQDIRDQCIASFSAPETKTERLRALSKLERFGDILNISEGRVLVMLAQAWKKRLEQFPSKPAELTWRVVPQLSFNSQENGFTPYIAETCFALVVSNEGEGFAFNIHIKLSTEYGEIGKEDILKLEPNSEHVTKIFNVTHLQTIEIIVELDWEDINGKKRNDKERKGYKISGLEKLPEQDQPDPKKLGNKYVAADRPLRKGEPYVGTERTNLLKTIKNQISKGQGDVFNLWGGRRMGKTSLIYRLLDDLRDQPNSEEQTPCVPVYINAISFIRQDPWMAKDFLTLVAEMIISQLEIEGYETQNAKKTLSNQNDYHQDGTSISSENSALTLPEQVKPNNLPVIKDFQDFINGVLPALGGKNLLLIFDDADVFGEKIHLTENYLVVRNEFVHKVWAVFKALAVQPEQGSKGAFFVMFATDRALGNLWAEVINSSPLSKRLELLVRDDVNKLLAWSKPLEYSPLAAEYFWYVTGGHPALGQLICAFIIEMWLESEEKPAIIPLGLVQAVVKSLVENADLKAYFNYIYQYSFSQSARETLNQIVQEKRIDEKTLQISIDELPKAILNDLKTSQMIRENNGKYYLRIGFFKIWLEN